MTRDHFKKVMESPYFKTDAYSESPGGQFENKIFSFLKKIFKKNKS